MLALTVAEALDELPSTQRQVLVLRYYADLSVPQIAEQLGIPVGTVKSRLFAAARLLRERLRAEADAGEQASAELDMAQVRGQLHLLGDGLARAAAGPSRTRVLRAPDPPRRDGARRPVR